MPDSSPIPAMKALTIRQPWASLIAAGVKTIETRSWSTRYRGPLAIHAGKHPPEVVDFGRWSVPAVVDYLCEWDRDGLVRRIGMPLGAVVATCTLADVVPIVDVNEEDCDMDCIVGDGERLWLDVFRAGIEPRDDQLPFGDFTPGRYAWLLTDITPTTVRCPVCRDNATGRERAWHETHSGGICDAAHGSCFTPWCRCRCHVEARCPVCRGDGRCAPVPAKGRQGLWDWAGE